MKCLYCDQEMKKISFSSVFLEEDKLCIDCRKKLKVNKNHIVLSDLSVESFYDYEGMFRSMLLQYKECFDEALSEVFLYGLNDYINLKYMGYRVLFVPSSKLKRDIRGFDHLELIFQRIKLKRVDGLRMKEELIQEGKDAYEREKMKTNYIYQGDRYHKILIVDDVITTGSSILGVYDAIKEHADVIKALSLSIVGKRFHFKNKV